MDQKVNETNLQNTKRDKNLQDDWMPNQERTPGSTSVELPEYGGDIKKRASAGHDDDLVDEEENVALGSKAATGREYQSSSRSQASDTNISGQVNSGKNGVTRDIGSEADKSLADADKKGYRKEKTLDTDRDGTGYQGNKSANGVGNKNFQSGVDRDGIYQGNQSPSSIDRKDSSLNESSLDADVSKKHKGDHQSMSRDVDSNKDRPVIPEFTPDRQAEFTPGRTSESKSIDTPKSTPAKK